MDTIAHYRRLFAHDDWANREALAVLEAPGTPPAQAVKILAHVAAARRLWLVRIRGEGTPVVIWPDFSVAQCRRELEELEGIWAGYLKALTPAELVRSVTYSNSKGQPWSSTVEQILDHLSLHGAYHRGQIALLLRQAGVDPAYTDFIHAVRQGLLE